MGSTLSISPTKDLSTAGQFQSASLVQGIHARFATIKIRLQTLYLLLKRTNSIKLLFQSYTRLQALRKVNTGNVKHRKYINLGNAYSWSIYVPPYPSQGFNRLISQEIDYVLEKTETVPLHFIFLSITKKCPLDCQHCFEWDIMQHPEKLSSRDFERVIDGFVAKGISSIFFTGGEPISSFNKLIRLTKYASNRCNTWLFTSGYGLDRSRAIKLKAAGLYGVIISIDHFAEELHNNFRGNPNSFQFAVAAVRNIKQAGLVPALSLTLSNNFVSKENLIEYMNFAKQLGAVFVQFMEPVALGKYRGQDVNLHPEKLSIVNAFYRSFNENKAYASYPIIIYQGYHQRKIGCHGAGRRFLYVDSDGSIQACPFCDTKMGNALRTPIKYTAGECKRFTSSSV